MALMMQESGGRGSDPMQASESLCGSVGCIEDPERSIKQGVSYFANTLERANGDVKLALQSYNFGLGFIDFVMDRGGEYTQELAIEFSSKKYDELKHTGEYNCIREEAEQYGACYGDIYYVDAVLSYYESDENLLAS
ncbi:Lysozyme-like [Halobacillus dabanensis]|uniref:Lysozyme-like n=2 Tax=Halobacillus dabanensis TaxID=240302 RepID=A0A1I3TDC0_HALDA|nr:Lysozyme-like [Halobacillus dabanensis]